jgi:integrase/recombinase XerD
VTWFKWLKNEDVLKDDHAEELRKLKMATQKGSTRTIMMPGQLKEFMHWRPERNKLSQNRAWTAAMFIIDAGCRIDETLDLRVNDFWFKDGLVDVQHGKGDKERRIKLGNDVIALLQKYQNRFINPELDNPYFFGTRDGKKMQEENFRDDLQIVMRHAGIEGRNGKPLTPHSLRHTSATAELINTGDIYAVQRKLGHSDISTTQQYLHLVAELMGGGNEQASPLNPANKFLQLTKKNNR